MAKTIGEVVTATTKKAIRNTQARERAPIPKDKVYKSIYETNVTGNGVDYYDKWLINVNRMNNGQYGITKGITVAKLVQAKMPNFQETVDALNRGQDWQNETSGGEPTIVWYFLHESVSVGKMFAANDVYHKAASGDDDDEQEFTNKASEAINVHGKPKIASLFISDKEIKEWKPGKNTPFGKPVFVND